MKRLKTLNPEHATKKEVDKYNLRHAVRAVVVDEDGKVALLHVTRDKYYKLPGGGIEASEDKMAALERECYEEIGCKVEVVDEIGQIVEHRKFCSLKQTSDCYFAKLVGDKGKTNFMEDEIEEGFTEIWVDYDKAVSLVSTNVAVGLEGRSYIVPRDETFLKAAKKFIKM